MSTATKSLPMQRKASIIESTGHATALRSAMILTSSVHTRDGRGSQIAGAYENTYQLEPEQSPRSSQLQEIVKYVLTESLTACEYTPSLAEKTKALAEQMKQRAKALGVPRYKYVALVVLGSVQRSATTMGSRCVWNPAYDTFGEYTFKNETIIATGVIYGLYVE